jgi:outer membrane protein OmpA-like peptidoglycan-associated protein
MKWTYLLIFTSYLSFSQEFKMVYFDFDKSVLNESQNKDFQNFIPQKDSIIIHKIFGFCDVRGNHPYNDILSDKRANHVYQLLKENYFHFSDSLAIQGFGKRIALPREHSQNRRTEIWYSKRISQKQDTQYIIIPDTIYEFNTEEAEEIFEKPTLTEQFDRVKKGDIIVIENIYFHFDSDKIKMESESVLKELVYNLASYPPLKIEIQAHICCNPDKEKIENLSEKRAKAIYKYLVKSGISKKRLAYSFYGSTRPIYPLPEKNESEKQANRRIEILILNK